MTNGLRFASAPCRNVNELDSFAVFRVEVARISARFVVIPMFEDAETLNRFAPLTVNDSGRRVVRRRRFAEQIVGGVAEQNARRVAIGRFLVVFRLRVQNIEPDRLNRRWSNDARKQADCFGFLYGIILLLNGAFGKRCG